jgi:hypothetical protein
VQIFSNREDGFACVSKEMTLYKTMPVYKGFARADQRKIPENKGGMTLIHAPFSDP